MSAAGLGRQAPHSEARLSGSTRLVSTDSVRSEWRWFFMAVLREWRWSRRPRRKIGRRSRCAAHRRPFLAASVVRREASVWGSVSGPLMPSSHARFGLAVPSLPPCVRRRAGNFDVSCRRSSVPVTTSIPVARTLPCHLPSLPYAPLPSAESHKFLAPPPPPAIAVSATF